MTTYLMGGKEGVEEAGDEDGFSSFSVRLPNKLVQQIDARRKLSKRSRNKEVELLLERQIDQEVARDKEIMDRIAQQNGSTLKSSQS